MNPLFPYRPFTNPLSNKLVIKMYALDASCTLIEILPRVHMRKRTIYSVRQFYRLN